MLVYIVRVLAVQCLTAKKDTRLKRHHGSCIISTLRQVGYKYDALL